MNESLIFPFETGNATSTCNSQELGLKGTGLMTMAGLGLPVPPGFVVGASVGCDIAEDTDALPDQIVSSIEQAFQAIEKSLGQKFGGVDNPLLLAVRSGAAISMPGMMDTVLNVGLNETTTTALAAQTGNPRFAWDSYRRFIQGFSQVVLGAEPDEFEEIMEEARDRERVDTDAELSAVAVEKVARQFLDLVANSSGEPFPQDVTQQLELALLAVFRSWHNPRAQRYREINGLPHTGSTAAVVQAMVFGNRDPQSCTGVFFTRNPSTGEKKPFGEYLINAQGEDVVSGFRTPMELTEDARIAAMSDSASMEKVLPEAFEALLAAGEVLEKHFGDLQEIEFTVESGKLYFLQTRSGKRTPKAGLRIAVEMADEGVISRTQAVARCDSSALAPMLVSKVEAARDAKLFTKGLPASPGGVVGAVVFSSQDAVAARQVGRDVILVRAETDPRDVHGMDAAVGILTSRGGMTSHAAVVARGMGKPCITAAMSLKIDSTNQSCTSAGTVVRAGDVITIDGGSGMVFLGKQPIITPQPDGDLAKLLDWQRAEATQSG